MIAAVAAAVICACGCGAEPTPKTERTDATAAKVVNIGPKWGAAWPTPTPSPTPAPTPSPQPPAATSVGGPRWPGFGWPWQAVADCESGDRHRENGRTVIHPLTARWHIEGVHSGGLQFAYSTWRQAGGTRFASTAGRAKPEEQIQIAKEWLARTDWGQWPNCSRILGLR